MKNSSSKKQNHETYLKIINKVNDSFISSYDKSEQRVQNGWEHLMFEKTTF